MRLSLGYQVLVALVAAIVTGLFLGPLASVLKPIGTAYVMLLQMAVLPYITLSIIHGLGSLTPATAKELFKKSWPFWVLLWGLVFFIIYLFIQLIPQPLSAAFLQTGTIEPVNKDITKNILTYLIPENPIYDYVNNIVPAIAIFSIIIGVTLMAIEKKEPLLSLVDRGDQIIEKILQWLAAVSPIAIFAHISVVVGTVELSDFYKIDFYIISFILITLLITFWMLPTIICNLTPLSFRDASKAIRHVCLLPFVTGVATIAIPFINKYLRKIGEMHFKDVSDYRQSTQTLIPISYSFAQIGNALILFFILFASFYFRHPFNASEKTMLSLLTIPLSVGSSDTSIGALGFIFKELNFPPYAFDIFTQTMPITLNFQVLLSIAGVLTFALLALYAHYRLLQIKWPILIGSLISSLALLGLVIWGVQPYIHLEDNYQNLYLSRSISEVIEHPVPTKVYLSNDPIPTIEGREGQPVFERIMRTGILRVGYNPNNIPYCYWNQNNELVGFDIAMMQQLAADLNCSLELVPYDLDHIADELNANLYDIAIGALLLTVDRIKDMNFTDSYSDQNNVLIVPIAKKKEFANLSEVQKNKNLVINTVGGYKRIGQQIFPNNWKAQSSNLIDMLAAFESNKLDADLWSYIPATVWCMNHPEFTVMDYNGALGKCYFAYPVRPEAYKFMNFMNNWVQIRLLDQFYQEQKDYWIMGAHPKKKAAPRWSIIRNVFHWVD